MAAWRALRRPENETLRRLKLILVLAALPLASFAQDAAITELPPIRVVGAPVESSAISEVIYPDLGANTYTITQQQISQIAQGENASFNQILARTPGISNDTYGAIHFRNEDPYYRYFINGTLLPSGINGFSQDIDTRFVKSVTTEVGALPAYYPEGNYGIVDLTTKSGTDLNGGNVSFYGGSNETLHPSFSYGGTASGHRFLFHRQLSARRSRAGESDAREHRHP